MNKLIETLRTKLKNSNKRFLIVFISSYIIIFSITFCYFVVKSVTPPNNKVIPLKNDNKKNKVVFKNSSDICLEIFKCYNEGILGPMMCVKGTLENTSTKKEVYWIFLGGLEKVENQTTTMKESFLSALNLDNQYKTNVKKHILNNIPPKSTLILCGHSLGGMVSQQLAADKDIKKNYKISYIIGFGSPYVTTEKKDGKLVRLSDQNDFIGRMTFINPFKYNKKENNIYYEKSSYYIKEPAHLYSYNDRKVWKGYDVIGSKSLKTTFTFIEEDKQYFKSVYPDNKDN